MKVELEFDRTIFVDMIKKMAIPRSNSKKGFLFPIIYPRIIPIFEEGKRNEAMLEWIALSPDVLSWVRVKYEKYTGLAEPFRIPIDVENMLKALKEFNDAKEVIFTHDDDEGIQTITDNVLSLDLPIIGAEPGENVYDAYPGNYEPETEIVLLKDGTVKPDISGLCDVKFLQTLFLTIKNLSSKNERDIVYNFLVDGEHHQIEAYTNQENLKTGIVVSKIYTDNTITGHGDLHYNEYLENVVNVLSPGLFEFYAIHHESIWIMQNNSRAKVRYLVPSVLENMY